MSEQSTESAESTATEPEASAQDQAPESTEAKPSETVDFWKQKAREQEKRAKDNAAAAKRLAEIEESQKSEAEKVADRIAKAEQAAANAEARALRREVALEHSLSRDDAELLDALTDEDAMRRLASRLAAAESDRKKQGNHVPKEGTTPTSGAEANERKFARTLFAPEG